MPLQNELGVPPDMTGFRKKLESWLQGVSFVVDLSGASQQARATERNSRESIWNAIGQDFQAVGRDMDSALQSGFDSLCLEDKKRVIRAATRSRGNARVSSRDMFSHDRTVDSSPIDSMSRTNERRDDAANA